MLKAKTIRRLPAHTRKIAKDLNELEKLVKRLFRNLDVLAQHERDSLALYTRVKLSPNGDNIAPFDDWLQDSILSRHTKGK